MRTRLRWGGFVAAASAAVLAVPLSALGPAHAAGPVDLSIIKTVAGIGPAITFDPAHRDVGTTGHETWTRAGLLVETEGWTSEDRVYEHVASSTPLADVDEPHLDYTPSSGSIPPGFRLKVDINNNGTIDGVLIGEPTYYGNRWWLSSSSHSLFKLGAPSCVDGDPAVGTDSSINLITNGLCTGGNGSAWHGTLDQWRAEFPAAVVKAWGFGLGSGVLGKGTITGLTFAGKYYSLGRNYQPTLKAAPGETVEFRIAITNGGAATETATGIKVIDALPADLTYVDGTLSRPDWCSFNGGQTLTCTNGILPPTASSNVYFQAKVSDTVSSAGLPSTIGHNVDVQKQEVFADLTAGQTKTFTAMCPAGYVATDGGLLIDAVDQGGFYSDIVIAKSQPTEVGGIQGWQVKASNLGDERGQGKAKVTCLSGTLGSSNGHTHAIDVVASTGAIALPATASDPTTGRTVTATCPAGYTPIAPRHTVTSGIAVIRSSIAAGNTWKWIVDHEAGTAATFDVDCLAPETKASKGHTATLPLNTATSTVSVGAESRNEGVQGCDSNGHAITGGYDGKDAAVLSLGKEARGTNYMFRFYNDDWSQAWNADIQVTCVGVRTADEPTYYHVINTATISTVTAGLTDVSTSDNSSSADISIVGDAVQPAGGVVVSTSGSRVGTPPNVKKVDITLTCDSPCAFTVKVLKGSTVVAKATKSFPASPNSRLVHVPTTSAGKNLAAGDVVTVKVKTSAGTTTTQVTLS